MLILANTNFLSENVDTSREKLIKRLDGRIKFIPILDKAGKLKSVISKDRLFSKINNQKYDNSKDCYPTIHDGIEGMRFIEKVLESKKRSKSSSRKS